MANNSQVANQNPGKKKSFLRGVSSELKKVIWPTKQELINNEFVVVTFTLLVSFLIWVFDFGFSNGIHQILSMAGK